MSFDNRDAVLNSLRQNIYITVFGEDPKNEIFRGIRSYFDNRDNCARKIKTLNLEPLRRYLMMAKTDMASHYLKELKLCDVARHEEGFGDEI